MFEWKNGFIIYLKEVEKIMEFLSIIGVISVFFYFEDVWIMCDMWNLVNRLVNCEMVNFNKIINVVVR